MKWQLVIPDMLILFLWHRLVWITLLRKLVICLGCTALTLRLSVLFDLMTFRVRTSVIDVLTLLSASLGPLVSTCVPVVLWLLRRQVR